MVDLDEGFQGCQSPRRADNFVRAVGVVLPKTEENRNHGRSSEVKIRKTSPYPRAAPGVLKNLNRRRRRHHDRNGMKDYRRKQMGPSKTFGGDAERIFSEGYGI